MVNLIDYLAAGVIDDAGSPLASGTVYFYQAGTTTLTTVYQERELTNAHPNPATLDSVGRLTAFAGSRLKLDIRTADDVPVRVIDNVGIGAGDIQAGDLAGGIVTSSSIQDGAVTASKLGAGAVTTTAIVDGAVTLAKLAAANIQTSASCGNYAVTATPNTVVTNLTVTITTVGRPVLIQLIDDGSGSAGGLVAAPIIQAWRYRTSDNTPMVVLINGSTVGTAATTLPASSLSFWETPPAGTWTYKLLTLNSSTGPFIKFAKLCAIELG